MPNTLLTLEDVVREALPVVVAYVQAIERDLVARPLPPGGYRQYVNPFGRDLMPIRITSAARRTSGMG